MMYNSIEREIPLWSLFFVLQNRFLVFGVYTESKKNAILTERGGSSMYIDHDIIIEETLPAMLQENIADLERYYAEDNWAEYLLLQ